MNQPSAHRVEKLDSTDADVPIRSGVQEALNSSAGFLNPSRISRQSLEESQRMRTLLFAMAAVFLGAGCERPAEKPASRPPQAAEQPSVPTSVATIPEEFQSPAQSAPKPPATPRILFAATNFQVKTESGIQGIMAGETVNVIREAGENIVVQYGEIEFTRHKSFFSPTFVSSPPPQEAPVAPEPVETVGLTDPVPAVEPALPGENLPETPMHVPRLTPEEKRLAELTDSIRDLNEKIRTAQATAGRPGKQVSRSETRNIEKMKSDRDELSRQLTTLGKP